MEGFQYKYTEPWEGPTATMTVATMKLRFVPTSEGYFDAMKKQYYYNFLDHLGNIRLSYADADGNGKVNGEIRISHCTPMTNGDWACYDYLIPGEVEGANDYYPFGLLHNNQYNNFENAYQYKYQGQELQETGWYSFKWRNYMPDVGRFFNIDPLSEKFPYNSTYVFQENKLGMGVELEGLELLRNHTGFFAIHGNAMKVVRAPISQTYVGQSGNRHAYFTAGDLGLSTSGYNPNGARISTGTTGLKQDSYKYNGPTASSAQMQDTTDKISNKDRQSFKTTKTNSEMWNLKQVGLDRAVAKAEGVKEITSLINLAINIPNAINSTINYTLAVDDISSIKTQAMTMDQAIQFVDKSSIDMTQQVRNDVVNYIFDGTLPNPEGGLMPNSLIIQNGTQIMKANGIPIQSLDEQLKVNRPIQH
ncbi:MAG: hypothetical protein JSS94_07000 [Bacteroidetes bacterium]|nr:hypothetical protein [Bacteroidota bacterium]